MDFEKQLRQVATKDEMHRQIDGLSEHGKALLITFDPVPENEFRYLGTSNVHIWEAIGLLESARDHVRLPSDFTRE